MLTLAQRRTFEFIRQFMLAHDYAPTAAEIAQGIGIHSRGVVHRNLKALAKFGCIQLTPNRHRNICLLTSNLSTPRATLPLLGVIAAGQPIEVIEQHETIDVANIFLGNEHFALRVKGDSMIEEGIFDGDLVVCKRTEQAKNRQIVVALIDSHEATLKRFQHGPTGMVTLLPANENLKPQVYPAHKVQIQGLYIGLLRIQS